jgi:hypothetical protein
MKWSAETDKILPLMLDVQINVSPVVKNAANTFFNSNYADLNTVWHTLAPLLADKGLLVTQGGAINNGKPTLVTRVSDAESGQWVESEAPLDGGKTDPQGIGSAITYQRRYSLCAMFGLMLADDDGNAAQPRQNTQPQRQNAPSQRPAQRQAPQGAPARQNAPQGGFDPNREILLSFKPKTTMRIGDMTFADAEDGLKLAEWRIEHPGTNPKYQAKNKADAQEDMRQLQAFFDSDPNMPADYATSLPDAEGEPPF